MTMLRLNPEQRTLLADKLADAGNLVLGMWLLGQVLSDRQFSWLLASTGTSIWLGFITIAAVLRSEGLWKGRS